MPKLLSPAQCRQYDRDGLVFPLRVLTAAETLAFRRACDELETVMGGKPRTVDVRQLHLHLRWAYDLAVHHTVLDAVEDVLGPDLLVWTTELFAKHPHDPHVSIGWHRDQPYMGVAPEATTTAWIALAESTLDNGCMRALPRWVECMAGGAQADSNGGPREVAPPTSAAPAGMVDVMLEPGEMSLHDAEVLHGSQPNRSGTKRVGFVVRYVVPRARPPAGRPPVVWARGEKPDERFLLADPPTETDAARAAPAIRRSAAEHLQGMLHNLQRCRIPAEGGRWSRQT